MSWNHEAAGHKQEVKDVIDANPHIPAGVKMMILEGIDQTSTEALWSGDGQVYNVYVKTWGHIDNNTCQVNIEVRRIACGKKESNAAVDIDIPPAAAVPHNDA